MEYGKLINEILEVYNINASEFADKIGVQRSSISHILSGRNKPSLDFFIKVKEEFTELRWDYLLLGQKPMTTQEADKIESAQVAIKEPQRSSPTPLNLIRDEEPAVYNRNSIKKLTKIVWFYSDQTFEIFENK